MDNSAPVIWDCSKEVLSTENCNIFLVHHSNCLKSISYKFSLPNISIEGCCFQRSRLTYNLCFLSIFEECQFKSVSFTIFLTSLVTFNSYIIFPAQVSFTLLFTLNDITLQYVTIYI